MNIDFQELSNYFKVLPRHFNYLLVVQIVPLLIISSILVKEIDERLFHKQMIYYSVGAIAPPVASFSPLGENLMVVCPDRLCDKYPTTVCCGVCW